MAVGLEDWSLACPDSQAWSAGWLGRGVAATHVSVALSWPYRLAGPLGCQTGGLRGGGGLREAGLSSLCTSVLFPPLPSPQHLVGVLCPTWAWWWVRILGPLERGPWTSAQPLPNSLVLVLCTLVRDEMGGCFGS